MGAKSFLFVIIQTDFTNIWVSLCSCREQIRWVKHKCHLTM